MGGRKRVGGGGVFYVICTFNAKLKTLFVMLLNFNMLCYVTLCYVMPHSGYYQIPSNVCRLMTIVCASHKICVICYAPIIYCMHIISSKSLPPNEACCATIVQELPSNGQ